MKESKEQLKQRILDDIKNESKTSIVSLQLRYKIGFVFAYEIYKEKQKQ